RYEGDQYEGSTGHQCRKRASSLAIATKLCSLIASTTLYQSVFTVLGYMAPRIPPAIDATESLSPPMFAARRIASSADCITVASPRANGTIVNGRFGKHCAAISAGRSVGKLSR